jgi:hypothetical protein
MTVTTDGPRIFVKNALEQVRVERITFRDQAYLNTRIWFCDDQGAWHPTRKGLTLTPELAEQVGQAMLTLARESLE